MSGRHAGAKKKTGRLRATPWAIKVGFVVEKNGQVLITAKGLVRLAEEMAAEAARAHP